MRSMTGYGRAETIAGPIRIGVELRSVNRKQSDIVVSLPSRLADYETAIRKRIAGVISRGRVSVSITCEILEKSATRLKVDHDLARQYLDAAAQLASETGHEFKANTAEILRAPGVFTLEENDLDAASIETALIATVDKSLVALTEMQRTEGDHLKEDLQARIRILHHLREEIASRSPGVVAQYRANLHARLTDSGIPIDLTDERLVKEIALFSERCDTSEEVTRIDSHLKQFLAYLEQAEAVGRTLDFLCQELHRELNTIGSKANDAVIAQSVVAAKTELEKIREQVQNVQ